MKEKNEDLVISLGRTATEGYYDYQEVRKAQFSRIRDVVRRKIENIPMDKPEEKKEQKEFLDKYSDDKIFGLMKKLEKKNKIKEHEYNYLSALSNLAVETEKLENKYKKLMGRYLKQEAIWYRWLKNIKGISSVLGANLIKNFGYCENYDYPSSLRRHCGFDPDGAKGRHKDMCYSPSLKTFVWKIGDSFIKQRTKPYRDIYDSEKERLRKLHPEPIDNPRFLETGKGFKKKYTDMHVHRMAFRKMCQIFLVHYWLVSRKIKGLPLSKPYVHDRLGHKRFIMPIGCGFTRSDFFDD